MSAPRYAPVMPCDVIGHYIGRDMFGPYCPDCYELLWRQGGPDREQDAPIFRDTEGDYPSHCEHCNALIPHELTPDGFDYVREAVRKAAEGSGDTWRAMIAEQWRAHYLRGEGA